MNLTRWQVAIAITKKVNKIKTRVPENYVNWSPTTIFFKHIIESLILQQYLDSYLKLISAMQPGSTCLTLQALASLKIVLNARDELEPLLSAKMRCYTNSFPRHSEVQCSKERPCMQTELNLLSFRNFMVALTYLR